MKSITKLIACASLLTLISCGVEARSETTVIATGTTIKPQNSILKTWMTLHPHVQAVPETTTTIPVVTAPKLETTVPKTTTTLQKPIKSTPKTTTTIPKNETTAQKPVSGSVESVIRAAAAEFGVSGDRMVRVARCESTLNPSAKNGKFGGLFQFSDTTFNWFASMSGLGGSKWNASDASRMASWAFANGYASHWECK